MCVRACVCVYELCVCLFIYLYQKVLTQSKGFESLSKKHIGNNTRMRRTINVLAAKERIKYTWHKQRQQQQPDNMAVVKQLNATKVA